MTKNTTILIKNYNEFSKKELTNETKKVAQMHVDIINRGREKNKLSKKDLYHFALSLITESHYDMIKKLIKTADEIISERYNFYIQECDKISRERYLFKLGNGELSDFLKLCERKGI